MRSPFAKVSAERSQRNLAGFSLVEMSIVLTMISIIISGTVSMGASMIGSAQIASTNNKLHAIETNLIAFRQANNRLPCPADLTLADNSTNSTTFGYEAGYVTANNLLTPCMGGSPAANFTATIASVGGTTVAEGAVPVRTLGLPDEFQVDGWGRKFGYAVWTPATATNAFVTYGVTQNCGAITVSNAGGGNRTTAADYVLISYGPNGHGGYLKNGTQFSSSSDNANELTNCHCTQTLASNPAYAATYVEQDPTQVTATDPLSVFDDIVRFKERWQMQNGYDTYVPSGQACYQSIWVADGDDNFIQKFTSTGTYVMEFGATGTGNGQFNSGPMQFAFDTNGNIWVADQNNFRVQEFSTTGTWLFKFGSSGTGNGQFKEPTGLAIDSNGNLWVGDALDFSIQELTPTGTWLSTVSPKGTGNGQNEGVGSLSFDTSGNLWMMDAGNGRVEELSSTGTWLLTIPTSCSAGPCATGTGNGQFNDPQFMTLDSGGNVWVADYKNSRVQEFSSAGTWLAKFGAAGTSNGDFTDSMGIAVDASGNIWASDIGGFRVEEFTSTGTFLNKWGSSGTGHSMFEQPVGVTVY